MGEAQAWQDSNKHVVTLRVNHPNKHAHIHHQTNTQCMLCECMTYVTCLTYCILAPMHQ